MDTLYLTVNYSNDGIDYRKVCDSLVWIDGTHYMSSVDTPTYMLTNRQGCDSLLTLNLIVNYSSRDVVVDSFCIGTEYIYNEYSYTEGGTYFDTLQTVEGCDSIIGLDLTRVTPPMLSISTEYSCNTQSYTLTANNNVSYVYWNASPEDVTLDGQESNDTIVVSPKHPTTYTVYVDYRSTLLCPATSSVTLNPVVVPRAGMELTPSFVTESNRRFVAFDTTIGVSGRRWLVDNIELRETDPRLSYTLPHGLDSISLTLQVWNELCADTATVMVPVITTSIYAPNVFTPSAETNTSFSVTIASVEEFEISIYSRQGLLVYRSTDINSAWDGTHNGVPCQQGAYVYTVHYTDQSRPGIWQKFVGTVLLIR